jgi:hypothetical protein
MIDDSRNPEVPEPKPDHDSEEPDAVEPSEHRTGPPAGEQPVDAADPDRTARQRRERIGSAGGKSYRPGAHPL